MGQIVVPPNDTRTGANPVRTLSNAGVDSGAVQQVVSQAGSDGSLLTVNTDGTTNIRNRDGAGNALTSSAVGARQALDVNLAASASAMTQVAGAITAAVANTPGTAVTASTTAQVVTNVANAGNVTFHLVGTAFVGTLIFEASVDGGLNYSPMYCLREDGSGSETGAALNIAAAFIRQYTAAIAGLAYFRVRCSAFTSGTIAVLIQPGPFLMEPNPSLAASAATIGAVAPVDGFKATYVAGTSILSANIAGDIFTITGSATKTIRIIRVDVAVTGGGTITSAGTIISLQKRSTADSGGTVGAAVTIGPHDSTNPAVTATATQYTAAPAAGTLSAYLRAVRWQMAAASASWSWDFGNRPEQAPVLRGTAQQFVVNNSTVAAGTTPTLTWTIAVEWTEE